ncbi:ornithine cyclodeaminase family protein [Mycobacterium sp. 21AC1]|uniref:ornithine cyclodeaminase family protein n=1 Tax=[Mycobacterium] appelbergii TaxID=2939269 RepID=UPI0029392DE3|nr:ornithine cyclodeaminase family protein [Mycobacterium sp. 21AC1]MDV3130171.1 ornithine cyclodeaminase family protein [Mycobacterium sp. 21AC1]
MIQAADVAERLPFDRLVPALRSAFVSGAEVPTRHHHDVGAAGTLLLMPCWVDGGFLGVKVAGVFPGNRDHGMPSLHSTYLLCDATTGEQLAVLDGAELTRRRTIATAALAADYLARPNAQTLLVVGSGAVASLAAHAYSAIRPVEDVLVWNVRPAGAEALAAAMRDDGFDARAVTDLATAAAEADIISCATLATTPLLHGAWLRPGVHVDLVGSFRPDMREADDELVGTGSLFIDTMDAIEESGDLTQSLRDGALSAEDIRATLTGLCRGEHAGRRDAAEITVFKSVGTALTDLAAATVVYESVTGTSRG